MRRLALILSTAAAVIATPAIARDGQTYFGIEGGVVLPNDIQFDVTGGAGGQTVLDNDNGWEAGVVIGHDFGFIRLEAEGAYKDFNVQSVTSNTTPIPLATAAGGTGSFGDISGGIDVISGMVNALIDIGGNNGIGFSAGGGVGYAIFDANLSADPAGPGIVDDKDKGFAYQGIAQLRMPLTDSVDVGLKYKYFVIPNLDLASTQNLGYSDDFESHSVLATLSFNFGGSRAAPPPPP
ncbi:outer membrane beta-barrel protein, partial [Altererythrobacter sp. KTW20L]|uniref:outer membrane protein n=1 Tax=Altererythrobacter sp. KTW20L TaxID=2942210 RepID=UPI0020BE92C3|nr:outer membrane beta-barrel protein [Altererythrobacter sp. KTW20L]